MDAATGTYASDDTSAYVDLPFAAGLAAETATAMACGRFGSEGEVISG